MKLGIQEVAKKRQKQQKKSQKHSHTSKKVSSVFVALEEDAEELFLNHIETTDPPNKDSSMDHTTELEASAKGRKRKKKRTYSIDVTLDLHGYRSLEAEQAIDEFMVKLRARPKNTIRIRIITGKGLHSPGGRSVLSKHIYDYIMGRYGHIILSIDDPPHTIELSGTPIKGHFDFSILG